MKIIIAILPAFMLACSSATYEPDEGSRFVQVNECITRGATYITAFHELSGNCGPLPSVSMRVPLNGNIDLGDCRTRDGFEYNGCDVTEEVECHISFRGQSASMFGSGEYTWSAVGATGKISVTINIGGAQTCKSVYSISSTRM